MPSSSSSLAVLADTNVVSELIRAAPNSGVESWARLHLRMAASAMTIDELEFGFGVKAQPEIERRCAAFIQDSIDVLPVTTEIAKRAGQLRSQHRRAGRARTQADMLIAATAAIHGLTLVTRNVRDFEGCGIRILNPWT